MEKNNINEDVIKNQINDFLLNFKKIISLNDKNDVEIFYVGEKINNFAKDFSRFCFIENKVYIPCLLKFKGNEKLQLNDLTSIKQIFGIDFFSINHNELIRKDVSNTLVEHMINAIHYGDNEIKSIDNLIDTKLLLSLIDEYNFDYIYEYFSQYEKHEKNSLLIFVNVINHFDKNIVNLIFGDLEKQKTKSKFEFKLSNKEKSLLNFDYNKADSSDYHSEFNKIVNKMIKLNKDIVKLFDNIRNLNDYKNTNNFKRNADIINIKIYDEICNKLSSKNNKVYKSKPNEKEESVNTQNLTSIINELQNYAMTNFPGTNSNYIINTTTSNANSLNYSISVDRVSLEELPEPPEQSNE